MKVEVVAGAAAVDAEAWDALDDHDNPFLKHAFLNLLERSGSVGADTAWDPRFVLVRDAGELVGGAPAYVRADSYGEYVFDWSWASAAARAGIRYYPKITVAIPFTPATGPRLLVRRGVDAAEVRRHVVNGLTALAKETRASGVHALLCEEDEAAALQQQGWLRRATHQYHFYNRGYDSYDAFLHTLRSEARKQLRKERRRVQEQGVRIERVSGDALTAAEWARINALYLHTSSRKWGRPYLTRKFFELAGAAVGRSALVCLAKRDEQIVAMALSFQKGKHLYGRYWGASEEIDGLHFELCYHQLIEHAIANGHTRVEAGAQGEHKIKRGFEPVVTHSAHLLFHPALHDAVGRAVTAEAAELEAVLPTIGTPFKS